MEQCLPTRSEIDRTGGIVSVFHHTAEPAQNIYITREGKAQGILGQGREQIISHIQMIKVYPIDYNRYSSDMDVPPENTYANLLAVNNRKNLDAFVTKFGFTYVLREDEKALIRDLYRKGGIDMPFLCITEIEYQDNEADRIVRKRKCSDEWVRKLREAHLDLLWEKTERLREFVRQWERDELPENSMIWINRELELVSPIILAHDTYALQRTRTTKNRMDKLTLSEITGSRKAKSLAPRRGYRVYGHFALCVLDLYHDMEAGLRVYACEHCGAIRKQRRNGKRTMCSKTESKKCFSERERERQKKHYEKRKKKA